MNLPRILVAGVGNIFLGDDAFGIQVVHRLRQRALPDNVRIEDFGTHDFDLARAMSDDFDVTIIVDALRLGDEPGTLYLVTPDPNEYDELEEDEMETDDRDAIQELRLFKALNDPPKRAFVVGCEPEPLGDERERTIGLSERVNSSVDKAVHTIESLVEDIFAPQPA